MMLQVAVRLTAISLRLVAEILLTEHHLLPYEGPGKDEQQKLAQTVRHELDRALPYFPWQGARNHHGRVQYLMALLEEAIRVLAVPTESLTEALRMDVPATYAAQRVTSGILDLGQTPADVCGAWAAKALLSPLPPLRRTAKRHRASLYGLRTPAGPPLLRLLRPHR